MNYYFLRLSIRRYVHKTKRKKRNENKIKAKLKPNSLRFANPAEATWRLEAWKIVDPLSFFETSQGGGTAAPIVGEAHPVHHQEALCCRAFVSWQGLGKFLTSSWHFLAFWGMASSFFGPRPSPNPPRTLQNRAWSPPRRHFKRTFNLRRLKWAGAEVF